MSKSAHAAVLAICCAQPLWADVTPDDVWLNWQTLAQSQGATLTADKTAGSGDTLTLSGLRLTWGKDGTITLETLALTDTGEGTVAIVLPDTFPMHLIPPSELDAPQDPIEVTITAPQSRIIASGVPQAINYTKTLPRVEVVATNAGSDSQSQVTLKGIDVTGKYQGEAAESGQNLSGEYGAKSLDLVAATKGKDGSYVDLKLSLADVAGKLALTGLPRDSKVQLDQALDAGMTFDAGLTYGIGSVDFAGLVKGTRGKLAGTLGGGNMSVALDAGKFHYDLNNRALSVNFSRSGAGAEDVTFVASLADLSNSLDINGRGWSGSRDLGLALADGLVMAGGGSLGSTNLDIVTGAGAAATKVKVSLAGANSAFTLAASQFTSDLGAKALSVSVASPEIPVPDLTVTLAELATGLVMPVAKSDKPAPFSLLTKVVDLDVAQSLWAMVDPGGSLVHTPATLIIDAKGTATISKDMMDQAGDLPDDAPGVVTSLDIPQFVLRALGAEVTAKGAFTFDPTRTETYDMPEPTGKLDLRGTGLNKLIDTLVQMGLVPQEQAMQARMGLSMFGDNDMSRDEVTSALEFRDHHFFVNGAQMQ